MRSWDATGRNLPSRLSVVNRQIRLEVNDAGARYPVTVDPVLQTPELTSPNPSFRAFGFSVSLSSDGNTALVGTPFRTSDGPGAAYVFERSGNGWAVTATLTAPDGPDNEVDDFGKAVSLSSDGNTALIGADETNSGQGAAYVFKRSGNNWARAATLMGSGAAGGDRFGGAVALSGDASTALIGAERKGAAYLFVRFSGSFIQQQELMPSDADEFGASVALSNDGNTALVGAVGNNSEEGAAYVFTRSGVTWNKQQELIASDAAPGDDFGASVALSNDGNTALIGADFKNSGAGAAYVFTRSGITWNQQPELIASDAAPGDEFGYPLALTSSGNTALIGAFDKNSRKGAAYVFTSSNGSWSQRTELAASDGGAGDEFGQAVALSGEGTAFIGANAANEGAGAAYTFVIRDVSVFSAPSGRSFTLSGIGCPSGTLSTPYTGYWDATCGVTWTSPDLNTASTRYTFQNWSDGHTENPRTISPELFSDPVLNPLTANFLTEYQLTTNAQPATGGNLVPQPGGSNWYAAGTDAVVSASANPGFVFTGFGGALAGENSPQVLTMNGPQTVTGVFNPTPSVTESGTISAKTGSSASARKWTINITNNGPGIAYNAQLVGLILTQTFGAKACTPVRTSPLLPVALGDLSFPGSAQTPVTFDFSSCPPNARFTVNVLYVANGGSAGGMIQLVNQLQ